MNAPQPFISESTGLRLVGKYGRGPSVEVTGRDSLVFLSLGSEVAIINFADTAHPQILAEVQAAGLVGQAAVRDSLLYIGCFSGQSGIEVWNIQNPAEPVFRSRTATSLSGFCVRDSFLYVTQPTDTFRVYSIANPAGFRLLGSCRDSGDAVTVTNNAAFIADRWGLYALDVSDPANPHRVGSYPGVPIDVEARGNICCATFMNPNDPDWLRFSILDVSDPASIKPIASLDSAGGSDIYLGGQLAFVSGYYAGGHEFEILSIGDSAHPSRVGSYVTPGPNNGVWANGDWTRAYVADGFQGLAVLDISNLNSPRLDSYMAGADLSEDITVDGQWAYVANEQSGLQILDVADPTHPLAIGNYDTVGFRPMNPTVAARDSFAFIQWDPNARRFFRSVDVSDKAKPVFAGDCVLFNPPEAMALRDSFVYVAEVYRFQVVNVARPRQPVLVGSCATGDLHEAGLWIQGDLAYLAGAYDGLYILDISNPLSPAIVRILSGVSAWGCCVRDSLLFVSDFDDSLHIWSVANLSSVYQLGAVHVSGAGYDVKVLGDHAFVGADGLGLVDISDVRNPRLLAYYTTPDFVRRVVCDSPYVYAASWSAGVCIFDTATLAVADRSEVPVRPGEARVLGSVTNGRVSIEFAETAGREVHLQVFDVTGKSVGRADVLAVGPGTRCCQLDLSSRAAGVYIVRVNAGDRAYQLRITKLQ
jgi:hypothetical protein